jgi:tRNA (adenine57-N1/adenine58-N1)-methyltransferase catalytic subunit
VGNLVVRFARIEDGVRDEGSVDRVLLDLPEPWTVLEPVSEVLRPGGILLSYLPTIIQAQQITEALRRRSVWGLTETFETLVRPWNIDGQSVRPFHRMVAHTGFITVARRVVGAENGMFPLGPQPESAAPESPEPGSSRPASPKRGDE